MSIADLIEFELAVFKPRLMRALEFLKQNISEEKRDEFYSLMDNVNEAIGLPFPALGFPRAGHHGFPEPPPHGLPWVSETQGHREQLLLIGL